MSRRGLTLTFGLVECRCGEQRIFSQPCGACGRRPESTEVDPKLQRRKRLVEFTRKHIDESAPSSVDDGANARDSIQPLLEQTGHALSSLVPLANQALAGIGQDGFAEFAASAHRLATFGRDCERLTQLRPARALREPFYRLAEGLADVVESLLTALVAGTIEVAQHHGNRVQPAIDRAADAIADAGDIFRAWSAIDDSPDPLTTLIGLVAQRTSGDDLLGLAAFGQAEVTDRFPDVRVPVEHGVLVSLLLSQAAMLHDSDSFWTVTRRVYELVRSKPETLETLAGQLGWRLRWSKAIAQAFWASERFTTMLNLANHDEAIVRTVLEACHDIQEGLTKSVLATVRFVANPNIAYETLLANGTASLAEWAVAHGIPEATSLTVPSRNAFAHNDWSIDSGEIVLCELKPPASGPVRLTAEELEDHALAVQEVTLAAFLGIFLAAGTCGIPMPEDDQLVATSASPIARALLAAGGWSEIEVTASETVQVTGQVARRASLTDLAPLAQLFSSSTHMAVRAQTPEGTRFVNINLISFRAWSTEDIEDRKTLAFAQLLHDTLIDGEPVANLSQVRRVVAAVTSRWVIERDDERGVVAVFKKAREVASACGDDELLRAVKTAQGWRHSVLHLGMNRPVSELETYLGWAKIEPDVTMTF